LAVAWLPCRIGTGHLPRPPGNEPSIMRTCRVLVAALLLAGAWVWGQDTAPADAPQRQASLPVRPIVVDGAPHPLVRDGGKLYVSGFHGENLTVCDARKRRAPQKLHLDAQES